MRKALSRQNGIRKTFTATFERLGKKVGYNGYSEETILLKNIMDAETNQIVADHLWFGYTKGFQDIRLAEGASIAFDARVKEYTKGYVNRKYQIDEKKKDYKLSHPTKIRLL